MFRSAILFVIFCFSFLSRVSVADDLAVKNLADQLAGTHTISADFKQTIKDIKGTVLQEATGHLLVKRPNKLHWITHQPYEYLVVTNGETLWLYDIDLEQVNLESYQNNIDKAPALLLSGNVDAIIKNYAVKQQQDVTNPIFELTPKLNSSAFSNLVISFSDKQISSMILTDNFDQVTTITFFNIQTNQTLADQQFNFVAPDGVEVINNDS